MNKSLIVAVLTVTMFIMMTTAGFAAPGVHNFRCEGCHGKFGAKATGDFRVSNPNNACLACHSIQGEGQGKPIEIDALSNYFGTYTAGQPATGSRSTHTWVARSPSGPTNTSPAKVVDSTNPLLAASSYNASLLLANTTACIRCHNIKDLANNYTTANRPLLRISNANNALCLECHNSRSTSTHTSGSHPVFSKSYSSVYKSNTTAFRKTPRNANSYNPTSNLGNYLIKDKIVCTTCHAPHYADSSSATLDDKSTANGSAADDDAKGLKGRLQNSKGQLLRTDPVGATANAVNICSSCHKETANLNHNGNGQNVQCDHCHGAHVDFTAVGVAPNLYLVRSNFSNVSIAAGKGVTAGKNAIYNTATSLRFKRADGKGICQICHTPTPGVAIHDKGDTRKEDCLVCHKHENGFSASNCTSCHGQPPIANYVSGPNGKAQGYALDESRTPHATHADAAYYNYACKNCHYDGTKMGYHNTGSSFTDVFIDTTGSVGDQPGLTKNIAGDYAGKTCANVYCHSNGNPRVTGIGWKSATTPSWENGKNTIIGQADECITCHNSDADSGSVIATNAHYAHVFTNNIKCFVCHADTVTAANGIADRTMHANGSKDVEFATQPPNFRSVFHGTYDKANATCTNSCHTNGLGFAPISTAKWTESAARKAAYCGACHAKVPTTSLHPLHLTGDSGPKLGTDPVVCANCHINTPATHANGLVDLKAGNSCAPCHPGGAPVWAVGAKVTCESCHTGTPTSVVGVFTAPPKNSNNTIGHGQYSTALVKSVACTSCHNSTAPHIGAGAAEKRLTVAGNGLCNVCHINEKMGVMSTARANMLTHGVSFSGSINNFAKYTTANDFRARDCAGCHDTHGTTNLMSVRMVINGQPITYTDRSIGFYVTTPGAGGIYNGLCQVCHTKTKYFRNNAPPSLADHADKDCLDCHLHKSKPGATVMFAFQGNGGCSGCHGYPPVRSEAGLKVADNYLNAKMQSYSGGGGAHSVAGHIPKTAIEGGTWSNCSNCHYDQVSQHKQASSVQKTNVNVKVDPKFKFNNATSITYANEAAKCSNVSCHFKPSPNWTNGL